MRRQRRSFTDIICENCKYLPTKRSRNKRKPIPKESDVKTFNYTAHSSGLQCTLSGFYLGLVHTEDCW
ncbi:NinE family protein [Escherichia coli]|uniref:NinE family protein n=1 Tax=Escherichia coli TaxID=562 RepID=UPI0020236BE0|nr:NinE family protein [Escherichia coli]